MNVNLVKGDKLANAGPEKSWDDNFMAGFAAEYANNKAIMLQAKAERSAINAKVAGYIDQLDTNVDITELTPTQQNAVTNYLVKQRGEYANAASQIARIEDPSSPLYMELRTKMNGISQSFQNLATQVNSYKEDKASYLKDFDNSLISEGNELNTLSQASKLYTNEASLGVGQGGSLVFWNEAKEDYDSYNQMPKPFLKDFDGANKLLEMNKNIYSTGRALTGSRKNMVRQQVNNILAKGGRQGLLSLATDDFITEGGLGLGPHLFDPANEDALKEAVLTSYMDVLTESADQGAMDKRPATRAGGSGMSGALKDEINVSGHVQDKAEEFAKLSANAGGGSGATASEMANIVNSIDPGSTKMYVTKGELYNKFLFGLDEEDSAEQRKAFTEQFGDYNLYITNPLKDPRLDTRGLDVNLSNPQSAYEFYISNSDLSNKAKSYYINAHRNQKSTSSNSKASSGGNKNSGSLDNL